MTRILITEYSGSHGMSDKTFWVDFKRLIGFESPDVVACTEVTTMNFGFDEARAMGYVPVNHGRKSDESKLFVRKGNEVLDAGEVFATTQVVKGHRRQRYIIWVKVRISGEIAFFHHVHWVARTTNQGHVDPRQRRLYLAHLRTTVRMIRLVRRHGKIGHSFFMGDLNVSERADNQEDRPRLPNRLFRAAGLVTCYDERGLGEARGQGTHGKAIYDIIGKFRNRRHKTKCVKYVIHPKYHSDHRAVSAWYDISQ